MGLKRAKVPFMLHGVYSRALGSYARGCGEVMFGGHPAVMPVESNPLVLYPDRD